MVEGIFVVGWRSDSGAFIVTQYPKLDIDDQDVLNLFNLHRMNNFKEPNFNYIKSKFYTLASWYSGFHDVDYIAKPNYCVGLYLATNENPNQYESVLKVVTNNVLYHLNDADLETYLFDVLDKITSGRGDEIKLEEYGGEKTKREIKKIDAVKKGTAPAAKSTAPEDPFGDILALTKEMDDLSKSNDDGKAAFSTPASSSSGTNPFGGAADPFGGASNDPFGGGSATIPAASKSAPQVKNLQPIAPGKTGVKEVDIDYIVNELNRLDGMMPKSAGSGDKDAYFNFLEKKVNILEQKINVMSTLIKNVQMKEAEITQKNDLIKKLLALLR